MYEYFYSEQSEQFAFYRIPKVLFTDDEFVGMSLEAKVLYGLLLDRMCLSRRKGWIDEHNRVYIIYTIEEVMNDMHCKNQKAVGLFAELEKKCGLIERKRQGLGKPNIIYVKNFIRCQKSHFKKCENHTSGDVKITLQEVLKSHANNTDINNTDYSDTDNPIFPSVEKYDEQPVSETSDMNDKKDEREAYMQIIKDNIEYDFLIKRYPYEAESINEMIELMTDTVCSKGPVIRVAGDDKPQAVVKSQLLKLTSEHISYCLDCLKENTTDVKNIRQYILTALYNAPLTISNYYSLKVGHDMAIRRH